MKKRLLIIVVAMVLVIGTLIIIFMNSNYHYSKKLIKAIEEKDIVIAQEIVKKKPTCVNTVPTIMPKWFYTFLDIPRPTNALYNACDSDNLEFVRLLIDSGADVNGVEQATPLSIVYLQKKDNWYAISLMLIENGASLDYITEYSGEKSAVLQDIVRFRSGSSLPDYEPESEEEVIKAFTYALENCNHSNVNWMRVLQHSVSNDRVEIVKLLLDQGYCDVNDTSVGITALMFAARDSSLEMVQLLLDYGADKSIESSDGKTAYDYAMEQERYELAELLKPGAIRGRSVIDTANNSLS